MITTTLRVLVLVSGFVFGIALAQDEEKDPFPGVPQASPDDPKIAEQVFIAGKDSGLFSTSTIKLEVTLYKPKGLGPFPLAILNHGSTGNGSFPANRTTKWEWLGGQFFRDRGFVVIAPMRRGRGASEGSAEQSEPENTGCAYARNEAGVRNAIEDIDATLNYAKTLPYVDMSRIVLLGVSRGGLLSVVYASRRPELAIKGTVNIVGGWSNYRCDGVNEQLFEEAGAKSKVPSLWIYGRRDYNYSDEAIQNYYKLYQSGNGKAIFRFNSDDPEEDGHLITLHTESHWGNDLSNFLNDLGFPKL